MLAVNIDIQDHLINDQTGNVARIEFAQGSVGKVYVKFSDEQAGLKAMTSSYLGRKHSLFPIEKCKTEIPIKKELPSPSIKPTQFPLS